MLNYANLIKEIEEEVAAVALTQDRCGTLLNIGPSC